MKRLKIKGVLLAIFVLASSFFFAPKAFSHSGESNLKVDDVVLEIMKKQGVSKVEDIDCKNVSEEDFERLGEAVMGYMHPDSKVHEAMDRMMGGEGSESLRQAHITMGKRYLGCLPNVPGFMGMMGAMGSMMESYPSERGWKGMMGYAPTGMVVWGFLGLLTWIAFLIFLVLGSVYFWNEIKRKK